MDVRLTATILPGVRMLLAARVVHPSGFKRFRFVGFSACFSSN